MRTQESANSKVSVPEWLLEKGHAGKEKTVPPRSRFLAKSLHNFSEIFENEFYSEQTASKPLFLQNVDARAKLLVFIAFIVFSACSSNIAVLAAISGIAVIYAKLSGICLKDFIRRAWAYIPALIFIFSIPCMTNLFVKGRPLFYIIRPGQLPTGNGIYISVAGLETAARVAMRAGISISFGFLLFLTTKWSGTMDALSSLHCPPVLVSILNMAYRYIFLIAKTAAGMVEARSLRTVGRLKASGGRKFMGHSIACLFVRSHSLSEDICDAMICRGYKGKPVYMEKLHFCGTDLLFAVNNIIVLLILTALECIL